MKIHEYQAKELLARYGVTVLAGFAAGSVEEAVAAAAKITTPVIVVKSQIHAGGRGRGRFIEEVSAASIELASRGEDAPEGKGGVRIAKNAEDVRKHAAAMLGKTLVTKQTGPEGKVVNKLFLESGCDIGREFYLSMLLDRATSTIVVLASAEGGVDIEDVAHNRPEAIKKVWIDPFLGMTDYNARNLALFLGLQGESVNKAVKFLKNLYKAYLDLDCSMLEVNPLVETKDGDVVALDAKVTFDDNALFRHKDYEALRDVLEEDENELAAAKFGLSYVSLDGNIGCLVNGAGLAMATMDIIQFKGAKPANFLDVGGGANQEQVAAAFRIITKDPRVEGILVNIFGGIMKCDVIANGVIAAVKETGLKVPLVVRLAGTNVELGREILKNSGLNVIPATTLDEAAEAIVSVVKNG